MIVDASAMLSLLLREEGFEAYERAMLASEQPLLISPMNYLEIVARLLQMDNSDILLDQLDDSIAFLSIEIVETTVEQAHMARHAYSTYGKGRHPARLNLGDCFAYALAKSRRMPLLFKGDDFTKTDIEAAI